MQATANDHVLSGDGSGKGRFEGFGQVGRGARGETRRAGGPRDGVGRRGFGGVEGGGDDAEGA